jgi:hypothetical protein
MTLCWACHAHSDAEVLRDIALNMIGEHGFFRLKMMALLPSKVDVGMVLIGLQKLTEETGNGTR